MIDERLSVAPDFTLNFCPNAPTGALAALAVWPRAVLVERQKEGPAK